MASTIAYCKIFPPIGVARVGDSTERDGFFIGPDGIAPPPTRYKDAQGAVLRQAALFRVYGFDAENRVVGEITADEATITWTAELANKKSDWYAFNGAKKAIAQFQDPEAEIWDRRNAELKDPVDRAQRLVIDPGKSVSIAGKDTYGVDPDWKEYAFIGKFQNSVDVYLGELRTDEAGRLLVLGGRGHSAAIDENGKDVSPERWITHYANNDYWHDDTSDGPVSCAVAIDGHPVEVRGRAWVLVTPPDFAPAIANIITLFDVMENVALECGLPYTGLPAPIDDSSVEFWRDIHPILARADNYSWVSDLGLRGHAKGKGGDFSEPALLAKLADQNDEDGKLSRQHIFARIRKPLSLLEGEREKTLAQAQANGHFMPALSGDEGDATTGDPTTWLTVTPLQYRRLERWAGNDFVAGDAPSRVGAQKAPKRLNASRPPGPTEQPGVITRTVLDCCTGGAFFPGIEMTAIARVKEVYAEAYRLADGLEPGDITKFMAVPWQADFFECNTHWWPAQRPDSVITAHTADELSHAFDYERKTGDLPSLMLVRQPWARGVDVARPDPSVIEKRLFPAPTKDESIKQYVEKLSESVTSVLSRLTLAATPVKTTLAERVPGLGRVQYLVQEQFDVYSGRYFHFNVPSVGEFPDSKEHSSASDSNATGSRRSARGELIERSQFGGATAADCWEQISKYVGFITKHLGDYVTEVLSSIAKDSDSAMEYYNRLAGLSATVGGFANGPRGYEGNIRKDFDSTNSEFFTLRLLDMAQCVIDLQYQNWSTRSGDNGMVKGWSSLGFVVEQTLPPEEGSDAVPALANVETERPRLDGMLYRDYYYMLCNIEQFPEMYEYSVVMVDRFLRETRELIDHQLLGDGSTEIIETYFDYDKSKFAAKLEEIYEYFRAQAVATKPWEIDECRTDMANRFVHLAPFNQNDGAWLRYIANAGPTDEVRGLLFEVWSDEYGNGNPALHHGNLYTTFLRGINIMVPDVTSREYADYQAFSDPDFVTPVLELAISENSDRYFAEILGMTLNLEWEVLSLMPGVKRYNYHGFDTQFWRMHVGIDNAVDGHGAKAREGTELYLDDVLRESGMAAMQREWKRIWTGFVAFQTTGSNYMGIDDLVAARRPKTVYELMLDLISRKQHYGSLNHGGKTLGVNQINDWFDDADGFIDELAHSAYVTPGDPDGSRIITYLTTFNGPMYEVFSSDDLSLWRRWIGWLGREGDTAAVKIYRTKAESMLLLLQELRGSLVGTDGHTRYRLEDKTLRDWFAGDLVEFMRELGKPGNPWVVPFDAGSSPLVRDFAAGTNRMAQALDQRFPSLGNQVGRLVIVRWINAGCPIPGEITPSVATRRVALGKRRMTLVEFYGSGAVH